MEKGFYCINSRKLFDRRVWQAKSNGYKWATDNPKHELLYDEARSMFHGNSKLLLHLFHNDITERDEMQVTTVSVINTYPQYKGKVLVVL